MAPACPGMVIKSAGQSTDNDRMTARVFAAGRLAPRMEIGIGIGELAGRILFVVLLVAAPLLPEISSSIFEFPAVTNWWVCLPFCALFLLALLDVRHLRRIDYLNAVGNRVAGRGWGPGWSGGS